MHYKISTAFLIVHAARKVKNRWSVASRSRV
jgi:hypothetical protein